MANRVSVLLASQPIKTFSMKNFDFNPYYEKIGKNQTGEVIEQLLQLFPSYKSELTLVQRRFTANQNNKMTGVIKREDFDIENNSINGDLIAFMDSLSRGDEARALGFLGMETNSESDAVVNTLISNQLDFVQRTIKENKVFRNAVGALFLAAIVFTVIVAFRHYSFLSEELKVVGLLASNILLYIAISIVALYALSLIIKGGVFNIYNLNFFKKTLKK
jgi:hypothetical protein